MGSMDYFFKDGGKSTDFLRDRFRKLTRSLSEPSPASSALAKMVVRDHTVKILKSRGVEQSELEAIVKEVADSLIQPQDLDKALENLDEGDEAGARESDHRRGVNYIVECRLSSRCLGSLCDKDLASVLSHWVLFSYSFTAEDLSLDRIRKAASDSFEAARKDLENSDVEFFIRLDEVAIRRGSIVISLLVSGLVTVSSSGVPLTIASIGTAGIAGWLAQEFFGGVLQSLGGKFLDRFINLWGRDGIVVEDMEGQARQLALNVAAERGCRLLRRFGGFEGNGWYRYDFELAGCDARLVTIQIDRSGKMPLKYEVK